MINRKRRNWMNRGGLTILPALMLALSPALTAGEGRPKAADFSLKDLDGNVVQLSKHLGKGPVVINFWATYCKPCMKELPHIDQV